MSNIENREIKCPFCTASFYLPENYDKGAYKLRCDVCHRTFLLVVKLTFGFWKACETRIL